MPQTAVLSWLLIASIIAVLGAAGEKRSQPVHIATAPETYAATAGQGYRTKLKVASALNNGVPPNPGATRTGPCDPALNNTSWFDGCNTCICNDGVLAVCTLKYCSENYHMSMGCPAGMNPGDTWFVYCNKFTCSSPLTGVFVTIRTLNGHCWDTPKQQTARLQLAPSYARKKAASASALMAVTAGPCANRDFWFDGCNNCRCRRGEPVLCTRRACYDNELVIAGCPSGKQAGDSWYADCNRHECSTLNGGRLLTRSTIKGQCW